MDTLKLNSLLALVLLSFCTLGFSQTPCFDDLYHQGKVALKGKKYGEAFGLFIVARDCFDKPEKDKLDYYIDTTSTAWTNELNELRREEQKHRRTAEREKINAEAERDTATILKRKAEKSSQLIYSLYVTDFSVKALKDKYYDDALGAAHRALESLYLFNSAHPKDTIAIPPVILESFGNAVFNRYKKMLNAHQGSVIQLGLDQLGDRFFTIGRDHNLKLWNYQGEQIDSINNDTDYFLSASFSENAEQLLICERNGKALGWKSSTDTVSFDGHKGAIVQGAILKDERLITISRDGTAKLWNPDGTEIDSMPGDGSPLLEFILTKDNKTGIFRSANKVFIWKIDNPEDVIPLEHNGALIYAIDLSPNEQFLLTTSSDESAKIWKLNGALAHTLQHNSPVYTGVFSPKLADKQILTGTKDGKVWVWDFSSNSPINNQPLRAHTGFVEKIAYSGDSQKFISLGRDSTVQLHLNKKITSLRSHRGTVNSVYFSPDNEEVLTASDDGTAKLWSIAGEVLMNMEMGNAPISQAVFSPSGDEIIAVTTQGNLFITPVPTRVFQQINQKKITLAELSRDMKDKIAELSLN